MKEMKSVPYTKYSDYTGREQLRYPEGTILPVSFGNLRRVLDGKNVTHLKAKTAAASETREYDMDRVGSGVDVRIIRSGERAYFTYGERNPLRDDAVPMSLKEFERQVRISGFNESLSVDEVIVEFDIPEGVQENPVFADSEKVYHHLRGFGIREGPENDRTGMQMLDLYEEKKQIWAESDLEGAKDPETFRNRERSRLITEGLVTDDMKTHEDIVNEGSPNDLKELLLSISGPMSDVATPRDISGTWEDHSYIVYELQKLEGDVLG